MRDINARSLPICSPRALVPFHSWHRRVVRWPSSPSRLGSDEYFCQDIGSARIRYGGFQTTLRRDLNFFSTNFDGLMNFFLTKLRPVCDFFWLDLQRGRDRLSGRLKNKSTRILTNIATLLFIYSRTVFALFCRIKLTPLLSCKKNQLLRNIIFGIIWLIILFTLTYTYCCTYLQASTYSPTWAAPWWLGRRSATFIPFVRGWLCER